jgi:hypothetical protein
VHKGHDDHRLALVRRGMLDPYRSDVGGAPYRGRNPPEADAPAVTEPLSQLVEVFCGRIYYA